MACTIFLDEDNSYLSAFVGTEGIHFDIGVAASYNGNTLQEQNCQSVNPIQLKMGVTISSLRVGYLREL
jgi:hypothetical protein